MSLYGQPAGPYPDEPRDPSHGARPEDPYEDDSYGFEPPRYDQWSEDRRRPREPDSQVWGPPRAPKRSRGSGLVIGLVAVLALIVLGGGGTALYLLSRDKGTSSATGPTTAPSASAGTSESASASAPSPPATTSALPSTTSTTSTGGPNPDTRTATAGDCLVNHGTANKPDMRKVACAANTYQVLKRLDGTADRAKCDGTPNLTDWYYFDSPDPANDFVLCLRKR